jgi:hypothetical protein
MAAQNASHVRYLFTPLHIRHQRTNAEHEPKPLTPHASMPLLSTAMAIWHHYPLLDTSTLQRQWHPKLLNPAAFRTVTSMDRARWRRVHQAIEHRRRPCVKSSAPSPRLAGIIGSPTNTGFPVQWCPCCLYRSHVVPS